MGENGRKMCQSYEQPANPFASKGSGCAACGYPEWSPGHHHCPWAADDTAHTLQFYAPPES